MKSFDRLLVVIFKTSLFTRYGSIIELLAVIIGPATVKTLNTAALVTGNDRNFFPKLQSTVTE